MYKPYYAFIGGRYSRVKRKNHFISFISLTTMLGIAIGVAVLITVLSVMNGFSKEIRAQMLSATPHITIRGAGNDLVHWQPMLKTVLDMDDIVGAAPFIHGQGMLTERGHVKGVFVKGIIPKEINAVYPLEGNLLLGSLDSLSEGSYQTVIGSELARAYALAIGDKVTLIVPEANVSLAGVHPRIKRLTVSGIYSTGSPYDDNHLFVHIKDAATLFRMKESITGIQVRVSDELQAPAISKDIYKQLGFEPFVYSWREEYGNFFQAIQMEKTVMWCILLLIISVAAFNLISSLVMVVTDKRADIAILRTMGATKKHILGIFMIQGSIIGFIGTALGLIGGLLLAYNVSDIVEYIERLFKVQFISSDVYFISYVPSDIHTQDVVAVCLISLIMSFLATLYPARKAASIQPAEALRYE